MRGVLTTLALVASCHPVAELEGPEGRAIAAVVEDGDSLLHFLSDLPLARPLSLNASDGATVFAYDETLAELGLTPTLVLTPRDVLGRPLPESDRVLVPSGGGWIAVEEDEELRALRDKVGVRSLLGCVERGGCANPSCTTACAIAPPAPPEPPDPPQSPMAPAGYCPEGWLSSDGCSRPEGDCTFVADTACRAETSSCAGPWPIVRTRGTVAYVEPSGVGDGSSSASPLGDIASAVLLVDGGAGTILLSEGDFAPPATIWLPADVTIAGVCGGRTRIVMPSGSPAFQTVERGSELRGVDVTTDFHAIICSSPVTRASMTLADVGVFAPEMAAVLSYGCDVSVENLHVRGSRHGVFADLESVMTIDGYVSEGNIHGGVAIRGSTLAIDRAYVETSFTGVLVDSKAHASIQSVVIREANLGAFVHLGSLSMEGVNIRTTVGDTGIHTNGDTRVRRTSIEGFSIGVRTASSSFSATDLEIEASISGLRSFGSTSSIERLRIFDALYPVEITDGLSWASDVTISADVALGPVGVAVRARDGARVSFTRLATFAYEPAIVGLDGSQLVLEDVLLVGRDDTDDRAVDYVNGIAPDPYEHGPIEIRRLSAEKAGAVRLAHCSSTTIEHVSLSGDRSLGDEGVSIEVDCRIDALHHVDIQDVARSALSVRCAGSSAPSIHDLRFVGPTGALPAITLHDCTSASFSRVSLAGSFLSGLLAGFTDSPLDFTVLDFTDLEITNPTGTGLDSRGGVTMRRFLIRADVGAVFDRTSAHEPRLEDGSIEAGSIGLHFRGYSRLEAEEFLHGVTVRAPEVFVFDGAP